MRVIKQRSEIGVSYQTIRATKSRINKGLLAVPVALLDKFPKKKQKILVYFDDSEVAEQKSFLPYQTKAKEARIGGLSKWFVTNLIKENEQIIIDFIDEERAVYRLRKESLFVKEIKQIESILDSSVEISEVEFEEQKQIYLRKTNLSEMEFYVNQYVRTKDLPILSRSYQPNRIMQRKENVPMRIRKILEFCYKGKCQITDFTFNKKNGQPYFEIHHIHPNLDHHWKNLLVVCPNIHAQFTFGEYQNFFDSEGWLEKVELCGNIYNVKQIIRNWTAPLDKIIYE